MKTKEKLDYEELQTQVIVVKMESMICLSGDNEQFGPGNSYGDGDFA